jgi:3-deoxy-D-arabino-heptulosonate 7-phosphate (DAHP) synthase
MGLEEQVMYINIMVVPRMTAEGYSLARGMGESTRTANPMTCNAMNAASNNHNHRGGRDANTHVMSQGNPSQHNTTQYKARHGTARTIRENRFG